jgi:hypothetical protein
MNLYQRDYSIFMTKEEQGAQKRYEQYHEIHQVP